MAPKQYSEESIQIQNTPVLLVSELLLEDAQTYTQKATRYGEWTERAKKILTLPVPIVGKIICFGMLENLIKRRERFETMASECRFVGEQLVALVNGAENLLNISNQE